MCISKSKSGTRDKCNGKRSVLGKGRNGGEKKIGARADAQ